MKRSLSYLVLINSTFIVMLSLSSAVGEVLGEAVYYLAFLLPILIAYLIGRRLEARPTPVGLRVRRSDLPILATSAAPVLAAVFAISYLTSLLLSLFSEPSVTDVSGNIFFVIFEHALLPSVLEEILFRYIPLAFLLRYSKKGAILYSAAFFALVHCNLYQLPYAFVAGVLFALLDIALDSIIPSVILHFMNNLISVIWIRGADVTGFKETYVIILFSMAAISLVLAVLLRKRYAERLKSVLSDDGRVEISYEAVIFVAMTVTIAVLTL